MIREEDPRFKRLEAKIGLFIALALAGITLALVAYGVQRNLFTPKYTLRFTVDRGTGFTKGMPVKLSGFRIGEVTSIALNDRAMVDVAVEIENKYRTWIRSDSTVRLIKEGLVGDNIIDLSVGSPGKPELKDNESIAYVKTMGLDELADEIADKVKPVLIEIRDIIGYVNDPRGDLKQSIRKLKELSSNLEGTRRHADQLLVSTNRNLERISDQTAQTLERATTTIESLDLTQTIGTLDRTLTTLDTRLPGLLEKTDAALGNISALSLETRKVAETTFPRVPHLISQTEELLFSSDQLINSIRGIWFLRDNSPSAPHGFSSGDSHE